VVDESVGQIPDGQNGGPGFIEALGDQTGRRVV